MVGNAANSFEAFPGFTRWGYYVSAAVLAAFSSWILVKVLSGPQSYSELIVGSIAWRLKAKTPDYLLLLSLVLTFLGWLVLIARFAGKLRRTLPRLEEDFHDVLLLLCTPAGLWLTGLLTTQNKSIELLGLSGVMLVFGLAMAYLLSSRRHAFWSGTPEHFSRVLLRALLAMWIAPLAVGAVGMGAVRLGPVSGLPLWWGSRSFHVAAGLAALLVATAVVGALVLRTRTAAELQRRLAVCLCALQVLLPAAFLLVIPTPWQADGRLSVGYNLSPWAWAFVAVCIVGAWLELWRKGAIAFRGTTEASTLITVSSIVAMVFLFKAQFVGAPMVRGDDYHDGEMLVPWWSLTQFQLLPFAEYVPARGMINYLWGAVLELFLDGKASSLVAMWPFVHLAMLFAAAFALNWVLGPAIATLALFLFPYFNGLSEIDIAVTVFVYALAAGFLKWTPVRWLACWISLGTLLVLWAPGQGALAILATTLLGFWMARRAWSEEPARLRTLTIILVVIGAIVLVTPPGRILLAALRYGSEQSAVNSIAHGINWSESFGRADAHANPWLYEAMRASWILVAAWAGVLILRWKWGADRSRGLAMLAYASPVLILCLLYVFRAAGRIDWVGPSRLGVASGWILSLLLPLLIFAIREHRNPGARTLVWATLVGLVIPAFGGVPTRFVGGFEPLADPRSSPKYVQQVPTVPQLGAGFFDEEHVKRLVGLKKVLDIVLDPDETYLDASGRHATYFYFGRRPPIETGSVYNLVTEKQQLRAIESLRTIRPPLVLIGADNIIHDGGPSSLRSNLLYRYLATSGAYKVVKANGYVWLISPSKLQRLSGLDVQWLSDLDDQAANPFVQLLTPGNLEYIPASWGKSFGSLEKHLRLVTRVNPDQKFFLHSVEYTQTGDFAVRGTDPHVTFDVSGLNIDGQNAGVLAMDFSCKPAAAPPVVVVYWGSAGMPASESTVARFNGVEGRMLLPLDAYPTWLLAKQIRTLRIGVQASNESCRAFRVDNIRFYQRVAADVLREGSRGATAFSAERDLAR